MLTLLDSTSAADCLYCPDKKSLLEDDSDDDEDEDGNVQEDIGYMTTCYHLVCPRHIKKLKDQWKNNLMADGSVRCHVCDDVNRPTVLKLERTDYYNYIEEQNQIRKDPKLAKKIGSYTGPHTKTQALLNDLQEFRVWSEQNPDERPIKR